MLDGETRMTLSCKGPTNLSMMRQWSLELEKLHATECKPNFWMMLGRAVMVAHPIKSTLRKCVQQVASDAGLDLVDMQQADFVQLVLADMPPAASKPTLFLIEQGLWSKKTDDEESVGEEIAEFRGKLKKYLAALSPSCRVVFVVTGERYDDIDASLRVAGCIDRRFIIPKPTLEQVGDLFIDQIDRAICAESLSSNAGKVGKLIFEEFEDERRQGLVALAMKRVAYKENRKVEFSDLVHIGIHGTGESETIPEMDVSMLRRVAVHEAGHALVCFIDSKGENIPEYISVLPGNRFRGVVADSYAYMESLHGKYTYEDSRHKIRSTLAGRAAESVVFGVTKVGSFGARSDLVNASSWAKELVGACGFPEDIDKTKNIGSNLLVTDGDPSPSELAYVENAARKYLQNQFEAVVEIIEKNRKLLDAFIVKLLERPVLFQEDIRDLLSKEKSWITGGLKIYGL